jgi:hypothetical protein
MALKDLIVRGPMPIATQPRTHMKIADRSKPVTAYVLTEKNGRIPVLRGQIDIYWSKTAAETGVENRKNDGHDLIVERVKIVRSAAPSIS